MIATDTVAPCPLTVPSKVQVIPRGLVPGSIRLGLSCAGHGPDSYCYHYYDDDDYYYVLLLLLRRIIILIVIGKSMTIIILIRGLLRDSRFRFGDAVLLFCLAFEA